MKKKRFFASILSVAVLCAGCGNTMPSQSAEITEMAAMLSADLFSDRDYEIGYDEQSAGHITLTGNSAESDADGVAVSDGVVTIGAQGTYILSGSLDSGMVVVDVAETEKVQLVLDGASITSPTSAAIYIPSADKVFITTAADSVNTLQNGGSYVAIDDNNIDGVIFAKSDLTLNGAGTLQISADVEHGIVTKDDLTITGGTYEISVAGHGLSGKDAVAIADGTFTLQTGKDGIQSDNSEDTAKGYVYLQGGSYTMICEGDGVSASSVLQVDGGTYEIVTGGGSVNGESHASAQMPGGKDGGMEKPETMNGQPPQLPEGQDAMTPPDGTARPERPDMGDRTPPEEMQSADGKTLTTAESAQQQMQTETTQSATDETAGDTPSTKGFKAGTALVIADGSFTLDCADDAFHANGSVTYQGGTARISTGDDAFHADGALLVEDGTIQIDTCYEGLEGQTVTVNGGTIDLLATDDGINAASDTASREEICITITGGTMTVDAGGDGLDSNGDLNMSGGTVYVSSAQQGADAPLDYDGDASITGGMLIGTGMDGMAKNFGAESTQCVVLLSVENQEADSTVIIRDENGAELITFASPKSFSSVVFSCPALAVGSTYTVVAGDWQTEVTLEQTITGSGTMSAGQFGGKGNRGENA